TDNVLGGNSIVLGDNDTGIKWISDGVFGLYANGAQVGYIDPAGLHLNSEGLYVGGARMSSDGNIWGTRWNASGQWLWDAIVGQLNTRGTIDWINGQLAIRDNNINARVTSDYVNQTFVRAVRLGPQAFSGALWRDYQLGGGNVVTGFHTDGDWEMEGNDDHVYYRPVQYLVNGTWVTAASV
ncbi:phage tail protein, partial [Salmonella enterica]|nr:phage tail protein [Salmonella enterica]